MCPKFVVKVFKASRIYWVTLVWDLQYVRTAFQNLRISKKLGYEFRYGVDLGIHAGDRFQISTDIYQVQA